MEYKVEDISPVKKKIAITVAPEEVDAAIKGSVALYKTNAQLDGFRKGKAPASVVEKMFHDRIYNEAHQDLINVHINEVMQKLDLTPVSGITLQGEDKPLEKGRPYEYSMEFEVMPKFDLPRYEGLEVTEEKAEIDEEELQKIYDHFLEERAKLEVIDSSGPARDGEIVNINFEAFENGQPVEGFKVDNFDLQLGNLEALPEFENLAKSIPVGHTGEGNISFPGDFIDQKLAGKTVTVKMTVHAIKERKIPVLDDAFAKSIGYENSEKLKDELKSRYLDVIKQLNKSVTQKKLLDQMLKTVEFELPQGIVLSQSAFLVSNIADRLEKLGKNISATGKTLEDYYAEVKPEAENLARNQVLLLAIAKKENLEVPEEEVNRHIYLNCLKKGYDYKSYRDDMERSGLIFKMRDGLLADKAMDLVYDRAAITFVEPVKKGVPTGDETQSSHEDSPEISDSSGKETTNGEKDVSTTVNN